MASAKKHSVRAGILSFITISKGRDLSGARSILQQRAESKELIGQVALPVAYGHPFALSSLPLAAALPHARGFHLR